jgi:putative transcriptional regulator
MEDYPQCELHLKKVMYERNLHTIQEVTNLTGLSRKCISKAYHNKNQRMDLSTLARLCGALDCEIQDLLSLKKIK